MNTPITPRKPAYGAVEKAQELGYEALANLLRKLKAPPEAFALLESFEYVTVCRENVSGMTAQEAEMFGVREAVADVRRYAQAIG